MTPVVLKVKARRECCGLALITWVVALFGSAAFGAPLATRWASEVSATNALPDYPRPQLVRQTWQNLNGSWDYQITQDQNAPPDGFEGKILVPFPIESHL